MDMLERYSLTADEAMEMERFQMTCDSGSSIWRPQLPSRQHSLEVETEDEAAEFSDRASDDDDDTDDDDDDTDDADLEYQFDPEFGYPTGETVQAGLGQPLHTVVSLNMMAQRLGVDLETLAQRIRYAAEEAYGDGGGAVVVPASDTAVAGLEKQAFHATPEGWCRVTGCAICLEDFEDGEEVTVMPCSRDHEFHAGCITEWLGLRNTCPLCRHALPTDVDVGP